jgi:site-specific recombinase XerD
VAIPISFVERVRQLPSLDPTSPVAAAAEAILAERESAASLSDLLDDWCAARRADGRSVRGVARYRAQLVAFMAWLGDGATLEAFTAARIRAYKTHLGGRVGAGTTRNSLTALRAFGDWCVEEDLLDASPARLVRHPKVEAPPVCALLHHEIAALFVAMDAPPESHRGTWPRNRRCVALMLYAGLRREEVSLLHWGDYDPSARELIVRRGKGGKRRMVPVCRELAAYLDPAYRYDAPQGAIVAQGDVGPAADRPLTHGSLGHIFDRWLAGRGLTISPHQLRRTFATELYRRGVDLFTIQRLLGHSDPKTTLRYIAASSALDHAAVERLTLRASEAPPPAQPLVEHEAVEALTLRA